MTTNNIYPRCALCNEVPPGGLHDGLRLMGQFICTDCESELIHLSADDPRYAKFIALVNAAFARPMHQMMTQV